MKKTTAFLLVFLILFASFSTASAAKNKEDPAPTSEPIPAPTLSPEAADYDEEHPENLAPDQLYALSAVLITQDKGEVIFEKDADTIREILGGDFPKSETPVLVLPDSIDVDEKDDLTTKVTFSWDDYSFAFFMKWRKNESGNGYILSRVLLAGAPETLG